MGITRQKHYKNNMKYPYANIACPNKCYVYYHYFIYFA
jgi:hypothetical protein